MRAQPEFRRVGLADDDRAGLAHALDHDAVGRRHEVFEDRRALGHRHAFDRGEVLHRLGEAMQRADVFAPGNLGVAPTRLGKQC